MLRKPEEKVQQRLSCSKAMRDMHLSALCSRGKPPGTQTPVNSGNKKMIKSDLMSHCHQAKTHICHSETDVTAPPSHYPLPDSHSRSHSLITLLSLMQSRPTLYTFIYNKPSPWSPQIKCTQPYSCNLCFLSYTNTHTHIMFCSQFQKKV